MMSGGGSKLAKAASQQLKGVIVEYDALCSTLLGRSAAEQAEERRRKAEARAAEAQRAAENHDGGFFGGLVSKMFVRDARAMLKDLQQDSTGKPSDVKDRLQSTLRGLPAHILSRVTGEDSVAAAGSSKSEDELYLEKQLASASAEIERMKERKSADKQELLRRRFADCATNVGGAGSSSVRDKYLDKLNALKAKAKNRDSTAAMDALSGKNGPETEGAAVKGLTTWLVHEGANELLSYASLRGLAKAVTPPSAIMQKEEFEQFRKEMDSQFEVFMSDDEYQRLPDPLPIARLCAELDLEPVDVLVIARHATTIKAARSAGAHTCHYMKTDSEIPNHNADYQLVGSLNDFQYIVEDFNGISYRGRVIY